MDILKEAERLYALGLGVHFIRPGSKAPVKSGWSGPIRDDLETLRREYKPGYGLGVRLGEASKIDGGYLANIDIDIKSADPRHRAEALAKLDELFPCLRDKAPIVRTGYGLRLFIKTAQPVKSGKLAASNERCEVLMPTAEITRGQEDALSKEKLAAGYRVRPAWEIEFMSVGRQVVLPPSIHPETKKPYTWERPLNGHLPTVSRGTSGRETIPITGLDERGKTFEPVAVTLTGSKLPGHYIEMITEGTGVENRSDYLLPVSKAMIKSGFTRNEILSVLTDPAYFLGCAAYDHAKTRNRAIAAYWLLSYTVLKAERECDATAAFTTEVVVSELDDEAATAQTGELCAGEVDETGRPFPRLERGGKDGTGKIKDTFENVLKVLDYEYGPELFKRDLFSGYNVFGLNVPWGEPIGEEFSDRSRVLLSEWFARKWHFETKPGYLYDAAVAIACRNTFHPIKDYIEGLKWDGVPRVDTWLKVYMRAHDVKERYLTEISRKFLVALIARIYEPGCQFDYVLILCGIQGVRKSTALSTLVGQKYFSSTVLHAGDKDSILKMKNKWLIELGELSTLKADVRLLKNFITTKVDRDRLPYGRLAQDFKRSGVLAGSTNQDDFLVDDTGDRRYWPTAVGEIDLEALARDRDQLFAEAKLLYDIGEQIYLSREAEEEAREEQAKWKPEEDVMIEWVTNVLDKNKIKPEGELGKFTNDGFSLGEIIANLNCRDDMQTQKRIGRALKINNFKQKPGRRDGKRLKLWYKI